MITTVMILDLLRDKLGTDYKSAKALGMTTQRIYKMRHHGGVFTDEQGLKAAEILNFPAESIILSLAAERSMNSPAYQILLDVADRYDPRKTAAVAAVFIFTGAAVFGDFLQTFQLV
jgi:hypothetical protein